MRDFFLHSETHNLKFVRKIILSKSYLFFLCLLINLVIIFKLVAGFTPDTEAPFLDLHLSVLDGFVSCKIYKHSSKANKLRDVHTINSSAGNIIA